MSDVENRLEQASEQELEALQVERVEVLRLRPGDILALRVPDYPDDATVEMLRRELEAIVPAGVKVAILQAGATFQRVTTERDDD